MIHIQYIRNRTQLFLDLELLTVDESGFWEDIRNESVKPEPHFAIPTWGQPVFGELPRVNYSREIRQIMNISPEFDLGLEGFESWVPEIGNEGCPEEGIETISPDVSPATEGAGDGTDRSPPETVSSRRGPESPDSR